MIFYTHIDSPIGRLMVAADDTGIRGLEFPQNRHLLKRDNQWRKAAHPLLDAATLQLREYFGGDREIFDLPLAPRGTDFQLAVWHALREIPYANTWSYAQLARHIGNPAAMRAVGAANGRNPIPIIVPCHRVIGANGTLTGFGGGIETKKALLQLESECYHKRQFC